MRKICRGGQIHTIGLKFWGVGVPIFSLFYFCGCLLAKLHPEGRHPIELHPEGRHPEGRHPIELHPIELHPIELHPIELHPTKLAKKKTSKRLNFKAFYIRWCENCCNCLLVFLSTFPVLLVFKLSILLFILLLVYSYNHSKQKYNTINGTNTTESK